MPFEMKSQICFVLAVAFLFHGCFAEEFVAESGRVLNFILADAPSPAARGPVSIHPSQPPSSSSSTHRHHHRHHFPPPATVPAPTPATRPVPTPVITPTSAPAPTLTPFSAPTEAPTSFAPVSSPPAPVEAPTSFTPASPPAPVPVAALGPAAPTPHHNAAFGVGPLTSMVFGSLVVCGGAIFLF